MKSIMSYWSIPFSLPMPLCLVQLEVYISIKYIPSKITVIRKTFPREFIKMIHKRNYFHTPSTQNSPGLSSNIIVSNATRYAKVVFYKSLKDCIHSPKDFSPVFHPLSPSKRRIPHILSNGSFTSDSPVSFHPDYLVLLPH